MDELAAPHHVDPAGLVDELLGAQFRSVRKGADPHEVRALLMRAAERIQALERQVRGASTRPSSETALVSVLPSEPDEVESVDALREEDGDRSAASSSDGDPPTPSATEASDLRLRDLPEDELIALVGAETADVLRAAVAAAASRVADAERAGAEIAEKARVAGRAEYERLRDLGRRELEEARAAGLALVADAEERQRVAEARMASLRTSAEAVRADIERLTGSVRETLDGLFTEAGSIAPDQQPAPRDGDVVPSSSLEDDAVLDVTIVDLTEHLGTPRALDSSAADASAATATEASSDGDAEGDVDGRDDGAGDVEEAPAVGGAESVSPGPSDDGDGAAGVDETADGEPNLVEPELAPEYEPEVESGSQAVALAKRDEIVEDVAPELARALKRLVADEQNEVLARARAADVPPSVEALAGPLPEHETRWSAAAGQLLRLASARAVASVVADQDAADAGAEFATKVLVDRVVPPLRARLEATVAAVAEESDGPRVDGRELAERLGAVYREWRTQRLDVASVVAVRMAHAAGVAEIADRKGLEVAWVVGADGGCSPDCEDNVLAGTVAAGEPFPTGHAHPPVHDACRCLLVADV